LTVLRVYPDGVACTEVAFEQPQRQRVLDHPLDRTLERPGAVRGIPTGLRHDLLRSVRQLDRDPTGLEPVTQTLELEIDDVRQLVTCEGLELDDLVDAVQELRPEELAQRLGRAQVRLVLRRLDRALSNIPALSEQEFSDLLAFLRDGLLDPRARPEYLRRFIPPSVPSQLPLHTFESTPPRP
jgi:hypothetical protein